MRAHLGLEVSRQSRGQFLACRRGESGKFGSPVRGAGGSARVGPTVNTETEEGARQDGVAILGEATQCGVRPGIQLGEVYLLAGVRLFCAVVLAAT